MIKADIIRFQENYEALFALAYLPQHKDYPPKIQKGMRSNSSGLIKDEKAAKLLWEINRATRRLNVRMEQFFDKAQEEKAIFEAR